MRYRVWGVRALVIAAGVWMACTGSDPDPVSGEGGLEQPCFTNGTCNAGLTCQAGRCRPGTAEAGTSASSGASGGSTSSSSGGSTSSSSSSSSGGPDGGRCQQTMAGGGPVCAAGIICDPGQTCCGEATSPLPLGSCVSSCPAAQVPWQCEIDAQCAGDVCCISSTERVPNGGDACTVEVLANAVSRCGPKAACTELGKRRACAKTDDCPSGKCTLHDVYPLTSETKLVVRVCDP